MPDFEVVVKMKVLREDRMIVGAESDAKAVDAALTAFGPDYEFVSVEPVQSESLEDVLARHGAA